MLIHAESPRILPILARFCCSQRCSRCGLFFRATIGAPRLTRTVITSSPKPHIRPHLVCENQRNG